MLTPPVSTLVPHAGAMCLLERVVDWNDASIRCVGGAAPDSPLAVGGRLPSPALVEYAAQAMAAHGVLRGRAADPHARPREGMLVALRSVDLSARWIEPARAPFDVRAERAAGDDRRVIYAFDVRDRDGAMLASGRATVVLETGIEPPP
ncbi:MAG: hydroxymyristoyl-ACP dehydratase [Lautropia sp.]